MADQQLNDRLDEFFRLLTVAAHGIAEIKSDVSELKSDVSELKRDLKTNSQKIDTLAGQFNDVANLVVKNDGRLSKVELDVAELKSNVH
jgi:chromosome segregation ATPase